MADLSCDLPQRVHFITETDCGYTLSQIRVAPAGSLLYGELHQRPTDEHPHRILPAVAILRSPGDLPTVGRRFMPEIVSSIARTTVVYDAGRVEIVAEDPPACVLGSRLRERVDAFLSGRTPPDEYAELRAALVHAVSDVTGRIGGRGERRGDPSSGWMDDVDRDLAGLPIRWVEDLAAARQVLDEIDGSSFLPSARRREHVVS